MTNARVTFVGNPWPEGHPATLRLSITEHDGRRGVAIELQTENYYAERDVEDPEDSGWWDAPGAWGNYHKAALSGWIRCDVSSLADLVGKKLVADKKAVGREDWDWDDLAFHHCYILGHDAVAGHRLAFTAEGDSLGVVWTGKVALAYVGERAFKHDFKVVGTVPIG